MILQDAIERYIAWRRAHGAKFVTSAVLLRGFCAHVGGAVECDAVGEAQAVSYLAGNGPLTRSRANKYGALAGFWRYAISRGYATRSPLQAPEDEPRKPQSAPPYVYSREELQRLFAAIDIRWQRPVQLDRDTLRALLLLLYGAGLRFGEAQRLTLRDVNLTDALLTVRDTKFHKNRLVPVAPQLAVALRAYAVKRAERPLPQGMDSTFLANRDGTSLVKGTVRDAFAKLLQAAGIERRDDGRRGPCLHSLRHTAAVNRLTSWYRRGGDVQRLLPALSTWLGHAHLDGTQVYLSMTPELLQEASLRFDRYVNGGDHA